MTILGRGDLVPPRRHRSARRFVTIVVVLAVLAGAGYAAYVEFIRGSSTTSPAGSKPAVCPKVATSSLFAPPHTVRLRVFNASLRTGLATQVRTLLRRRGFRVVQIGNALRFGRNVATIRYSPDERRAYRSVAAQIPGQATIQPVPGSHVLDLDLGVHFRRLNSVTAAKATERRLVDSQARSASPTPSCQPRPSGAPVHG